MSNQKPELLAPAGNIESFFSAVENGADAVYLGLKKFSARATAANFTLEELATLIPFARKRGVRIYTALNSIIAASEIPELLDTLHALSSLNPDALIVQDAGVFLLAQRYFPRLRLHASTLMTAHNRAGVDALERMGAKRIVLARELSMQELESICAGTRAELEVFIHGALCYSYSGLCLTSSFRGGRSGLRGECVQPCRLRFRQGKKEGFFLSCNDACALPLIPKLKQLRIAGFKIEGRMKPADYIRLVVGAYRRVLDADGAQAEQDAIAAARDLLSGAPSRHLTSAYLGKGTTSEILTPHRSGSSGIWAGTVKSVRGDRALVDLRHRLRIGDRIRPEASKAKEQEAFTVSALFDSRGNPIDSAEPGRQVLLTCPKEVSPASRLFKIGSKSEPASAVWKRIRHEVPAGSRFKMRFPGTRKVYDDLEAERGGEPKDRETLILKLGSANDVVKGLQSQAAMVFLTATRANLERIARQRFSAVQMKKLGLSLPPLISEDKDLEYYKAAVAWFLNKGFGVWEVNNWGHFDLLQKGKDLRLVAGARLNLRNDAALAQSSALGCGRMVLSLEITQDELKMIGAGPFGLKTIVTLYCRPPLFISRLLPDLAEEKPFFTARNDAYYLRKQAGNVFIYADRPVNWFDQLPFLRSQGFRNFLIDVSEAPVGKRQETLETILSGFAVPRAAAPFSLFNFDRRP